MIFITDKDEKLLLQHLKILKMFYRTQRNIYKGLPIGTAYDECFENLIQFINRLENVEHENE